MNWDAVGAVAEVVGSISVISTLFYLALQVRHARDQIRTSVRENRNATLRALQLAVVQTPELSRLMGKALSCWTPAIESEAQFYEAAEFTAEDQIIWVSYMRAYWSYAREAIGSIPDLTPAQRQEVDREIAAIYSIGPGKLYFESMSLIDSPALQYVRELIDSNRNSLGELRSSYHHPDMQGPF
ncbi:MAG: hypothetical protein KDI33_16360 [Halioglobus sp.]|nr:hypothetical protein [Halioglobus sp.]